MLNRSTVMVLGFLLAAGNALGQNTFHGSLTRTGVYDSTGLVQLNGVKWAFKTGGPVLSSPAVAEGVIYFGSADGFFYAVDEQSGKEKWKLEAGQPISSSPAVVEGMVYFTCYDRMLYAVAAQTGKVKWRFAAEQERSFQASGIHGSTPRDQMIADPFDFFTSSPAVFHGRVYFGSGDGNIYAVDVETGALVWRSPTGDVVHATPAIANNTVYIGSWDSNFYAIDATSGQEKWRFKAGEDPVDHNQVGFESSAAIWENTVYVGCRDGHVYAIDAATGRKKWDYSTSHSWVNTTPAVRDGTVFAGTCDSHQFFALEAKTGRLQHVLDAKQCMVSSPVIAGTVVYIGGFNGKLYALDTGSLKILWEFQTNGSKQDPLNVLNSDGTRRPFTPTFNDYEDMVLLKYRTFSVGAILSTPVIDGGEVYFGSTDGYLYALR